jgi:hypothetical protein
VAKCPSICRFEIDRTVEMRLAGKSQTEIAEALGHSQGFVSRLLRDQRKAGRPGLAVDLRRNARARMRFCAPKNVYDTSDSSS